MQRKICLFLQIEKCWYSLCRYALHSKRFQIGLHPLSVKPVCFVISAEIPQTSYGSMEFLLHLLRLLTKLYGKISHFLIFSQSFIKNDYFCRVKTKRYGKKSDGRIGQMERQAQ
jgi:hypothetical protein